MADGNTSGMGPGYPVPQEAQGWTFAGFVPWALFAFFNGINTWGAIGLVLWFFGAYLVYSIYMGIKGKELAWQGRRFDSIEQFNETMKAWNTWGIIMLCVIGGFIVLYFVFVFLMVFLAASGELD
jgi:hypothetical protein